MVFSVRLDGRVRGLSSSSQLLARMGGAKDAVLGGSWVVMIGVILEV